MQTIEIRQNKTIVIPTICFILATYYVYFLSTFDNISFKVILLLVTIVNLYTIYHPIRKLIKNEPVLVFSDESIVINDNTNPATWQWSQIRGWKVEKNDSGYSLVMDTIDKQKIVNISWLDKTPAQIEAILTQFHPN
jgi:hypothetical protein